MKVCKIILVVLFVVSFSSVASATAFDEDIFVSSAATQQKIDTIYAQSRILGKNYGYQQFSSSYGFPFLNLFRGRSGKITAESVRGVLNGYTVDELQNLSMYNDCLQTLLEDYLQKHKSDPQIKKYFKDLFTVADTSADLLAQKIKNKK
ncbi:MAG TPA: hypothetical protein VFM02_04210 [Candidatus Paceibacterota bacterium]|nr:hypothetical protein [Candidatus Paceibacterota bacterium]